MRILHALTDFNRAGGAERQVLILARHQKQAGHQVHLVAAGGDALTELERSDIPYTLLPLSPDQRSLRNFWHCFWAIRRIIKSNRIEIVHCHHRWPALIAWLVSWCTKFKSISTVHVWLPATGLAARLSFKQDIIIAVSHSLEKHLIENFQVPAHKVKLIHYGMQLNTAYQHQDLSGLWQQHNIPQNVFKIINIGRLTEQKGQTYLLAAFRKALKRGVNAILLVVGNGELAQKLKNEAGSLLGKKIFFLGSLHNEMTLAVLSQADIFVLSSLWEGLPLTILEAGLMKKPVISTNVDGVKAAIPDANHGLLVSPRSINALSAALERLYRDSALRQKLGQNLRMKVVRDFTEERMLDEYDTVYKNIAR